MAIVKKEKVNLSLMNLERLNKNLPLVRCKECKWRGSDIECPMCYEEDYYDEDLGWDSICRDRTIDDGFCDRGELDEEYLRHEEYCKALEKEDE